MPFIHDGKKIIYGAITRKIRQLVWLQTTDRLMCLNIFIRVNHEKDFITEDVFNRFGNIKIKQGFIYMPVRNLLFWYLKNTVVICVGTFWNYWETR